MLHRKLEYSAYKLSEHCNLLRSPALLWAGDKQRAVLVFSPVNRQVCFTASELKALVDKGLGQNRPTANSSFNVSSTACKPAIFDDEDANKKPTNESKGWHSFNSGWLGYFSYEAGQALVTATNSNTAAPLAEFFEYAFSIQLDFKTDTCELVYRPEVDVTEVIRQLAALINAQLDTQPDTQPETQPKAQSEAQLNVQPLQQWSPAWNANEYQQAFNQVQAYLNAGDCYQVNLAMPFSNTADMRNHSPLPLLRSFNPAFGGYLKTDYLSLYSVSPERFICIDGQRMETRPIKGTAARGASTEEDEANKAWLSASEKNQAENLMIVDLLRNDLSRYALPHSVKVEKLFAIETHANVHHMVSTISAQKRPEISTAEVIINALPGGSITGAPKKRAMEIIDELEAGARGPYCGVMGFFDDSGFVDFNILIRTVVAKETGAQCWAGGGVVLDSTCEEEWQELHVKVARILEQFGEA